VNFALLQESAKVFELLERRVYKSSQFFSFSNPIRHAIYSCFDAETLTHLKSGMFPALAV
jgi:hypothetical protein